MLPEEARVCLRVGERSAEAATSQLLVEVRTDARPRVEHGGVAGQLARPGAVLASLNLPCGENPAFIFTCHLAPRSRSLKSLTRLPHRLSRELLKHGSSACAPLA